MRKEDLKTGMLALSDNGYIGLVINGTIAHRNSKTDYTYADVSNMSGRWKPVKVSKVLSANMLLPDNWTLETLNANLLWEREEATEMTIKEIEERLNISNLKIKK